MLHKPNFVSKEEIDLLNLRRKLEKTMIIETELVESPDELESVEKWYMISSEWLFKWKAFV